MASESPHNTGISLVYEPKGPSSPIVDIVFVHGLQGHPRGTWTKTNVGEGVRGALTPPISDVKASLDDKKSKRSVSKLFRTWRSRKPDKGMASPSTDSSVDPDLATRNSVPLSIRHATNASTSTKANSSGLFWPADLLPRECPCARILTFGYDTKITNYGVSSTNKNSIYSHAKDLLFALSRSTEPPGGGPGRPIIFVAHSLGGIVVKEMLARSSTSTEPHLTRIVESTAAIVFLSTPHRGSPDFATAGDWVRSFVSFFGAETTPNILHALGLQTTDLERAQEAFSALWPKYNFRVKTFQEGLGLTGINIAGLGNKVVPDYSSSIGDQREHAETIQANHREMCRFYGAEDPGYRQVSGELRSIYLSIESLKKDHLVDEIAKVTPDQKLLRALRPPSLASVPFSVNSMSLDIRNVGTTPFTEIEMAYLRTLWFPGMNARRRNVVRPTDGTCNWLFEHHEFNKWFTGDSKTHENPSAILQIKGAPGSGKSVLMKEAYRRTLQQYAHSDCSIAAFFFNGKGIALEHSIDGMLRSLLYQLLPQNREYLARVAWRFSETEQHTIGLFDEHPAQDQPAMSLSTENLKNILRALLVRQPMGKRTFMFIDALDESNSSERASIMTFLGAITMNALACGIHLNLLISSRHFPLVMVGDCAYIDADMHNEGDIATYVEWRFNLSISALEPQWRRLRDAIVNKSRGVFLWASLAVDGVIEKWAQGAGLNALLNHLDILPQELFDLFSSLLESLPPETARLTLRLFQWAILSARPLQLQEWHHVLAFIGPQPPPSLRVWRDSDDFTDTDEQLERKITALSKGLLVVAADKEEPECDMTSTKSISEFAGAGSFMMNPGETRVIQAIHDSVHQFFKSNGGFKQILKPLEIPGIPQGEVTAAQLIDGRYNHLVNMIMEASVSGGHVAIMTTCLDYLRISELDALVAARNKASEREAVRDMLLESPLEVADNQMKEARDILEDKEDRLLEDGHSSYQSPIGLEGVDMLKWVSEVTDAEPGLPPPSSPPPNHADSRRSSQITVKSQTLEAYPALLSYAIDEFFTHARRVCDDDDMRWVRLQLDTVLTRLTDCETWNRWLALREELHVLQGPGDEHSTFFRAYLKSIDTRLERVWRVDERPVTPTDNFGGRYELPLSRQWTVAPWAPDPPGREESNERWQESRPPRSSSQPRHLRKQSSVKSFRSAASSGSHR